MLGAALGIERDDEALVRIAHEYAPALVVEKLGTALVDFHTVTSASDPAIREYERTAGSITTRCRELAAADTTTITERSYRQDVRFRIYLVAVVAAAAIDPAGIVAALNSPRYPLWAGRRSCPLLEPPAACLAELDVRALSHWDARLGELKPATLTRVRHDLLVNTRPRVFADRTEYVA
jgi:CRISPR system Cascade subunit CasD